MNDKPRMEKWLPIPQYEDRYEVSNIGRVRSIPRERVEGILIHIFLNGDGYPTVILNKPGLKRKTFRVHRLVMLAFVGQSDLTVNHKDLNKKNNQLTNLEYITRSENSLHFHSSGMVRNIPKGEKHPNSKLTDSERKQIVILCNEFSQRELAKQFSVSQVTIHRTIKAAQIS